MAKVKRISKKDKLKRAELKKALIQYLISLSIALLGALFGFFLQKVFGFSL